MILSSGNALVFMQVLICLSTQIHLINLSSPELKGNAFPPEFLYWSAKHTHTHTHTHKLTLKEQAQHREKGVILHIPIQRHERIREISSHKIVCRYLKSVHITVDQHYSCKMFRKLVSLLKYLIKSLFDKKGAMQLHLLTTLIFKWEQATSRYLE